MKTSPLFKTSLSNERLMTALLLVLILYNLPRLAKAPGDIVWMLLLVVLGLALDAAAHFILIRRPVCAVPAAVTALILYTASPGAPFWAAAAALAFALIAGKAIWGGTGKNPLNPAMLGLALLAFVRPFTVPAFEPTFLLLPAAALSLPFLLFRPYAGIGMMLGMMASLVLRQDFSLLSLLTHGVFFWSCVVMTDPVTTTSRSAAGFIIGAAAGFVPLATGSSPAALPLSILVSNILSYQADRLKLGGSEKLRRTFGIFEKISFHKKSTQFMNLVPGETVKAGDHGTAETKAPNLSALDCGEILDRIEKNGVVGCGGAAFPAIKKLLAAAECPLPKKHLLVNAAECDPGLVHDKWLLTNRRDGILEGIALLQKCVPFNTVTLAAKDFYDVTLKPGVRPYKVPDFYPAGAEKLLIKSALHIGLQPDEIPAECGILVFNVQTILAIRDAVLYDRKADTRYITLANLSNRAGRVVRVRLGDGVYETARKVFPKTANVYMGGGAMSARLAPDEAVIDERTNLIAVGAVKGFREAVCSQCNFCSAHCPAELPVREIAHCLDEGKTDKLPRFRPEACIECNLCSSVCPAGRDLAGRMKTAKKIVPAAILRS